MRGVNAGRWEHRRLRPRIAALRRRCVQNRKPAADRDGCVELLCVGGHLAGDGDVGDACRIVPEDVVACQPDVPCTHPYFHRGERPTPVFFWFSVRMAHHTHIKYRVLDCTHPGRAAYATTFVYLKNSPQKSQCSLAFCGHLQRPRGQW